MYSKFLLLALATAAIMGPWHTAASEPFWTVDPPEHGFGAISDMTPVSQDFLIANHGKRTLTILDITVSCELCLSYSLSNENLPPNDVALLSVIFNPLGYRGNVHQHVRVLTDDPDQPVRILNLAADVRPAYSVVGQPFIFLELEQDEIRSQTVRAVPSTPDLPPLLHAATDYIGIQARVEPEADGGAYRVTVTTNPPQPEEGLVYCRVMLLSKLDAPPAYAIPVAMEVIPSFHIAPQRLVLNAENREQFRIIFIRQSIENPVRILDVLVPDDRFFVEIHPEYGLPNYRINVYSVGLWGESGEIGQVQVVTDQPNPGTVSIPILVRGPAPVEQPVARHSESASMPPTGDPLCLRQPEESTPDRLVQEIMGAFPIPGMGGPPGWPPSAEIPALRP